MTIATWPNEGATAAAWEVLASGGYALDAVEAGARVPEADPMDSSVGYGGLPDRDGHVTLDACIMDEKGNAGSVTFLENILHPISVARRVMEKTPHVMLTGEGALQFAIAEGFPQQEMLTDKARAAWEKWKADNNYQPGNHDTIGILAIDQQKRLAGACTTSGWGFKMHGRVGDSPIIGAGLYVDPEIGGACATGLGEMVMKTVGSFLAVELMRQGASPEKACREVIQRIANRYGDYLDRENQQVGIIAVNSEGVHGAWSFRKGFSYSVFQDGKSQVLESKYERD